LWPPRTVNNDLTLSKAKAYSTDKEHFPYLSRREEGFLRCLWRAPCL